MNINDYVLMQEHINFELWEQKQCESYCIIRRHRGSETYRCEKEAGHRGKHYVTMPYLVARKW